MIETIETNNFLENKESTEKINVKEILEKLESNVRAKITPIIEKFTSQEKNPEKKKELEQKWLQNCIIMKQVYGSDIFDIFLKNNIPTTEIEAFVAETKNMLGDTQLDVVRQLINTKEELQTLEKIIVRYKTASELAQFKKEIHAYLEKQKNKLLVSKKLVVNTKLSENIEKTFEDKEISQQFIDSLDDLWFKYLKKHANYLDANTINNMSVGLTFWLLDTYSNKKDNLVKIFMKLEETDDIEDVFEVLETENSNKTKGFENFVKNILNQKETKIAIKDGKENELLNNPHNFKKFFTKYNGKFDKSQNEIIKELISGQKKNYIFNELSKAENEEMKKIADNAGKQMDDLPKIKKEIQEPKKKIAQYNKYLTKDKDGKSIIDKIKPGSWSEKVLNFFLKIIGFEDGIASLRKATGYADSGDDNIGNYSDIKTQDGKLQLVIGNTESRDKIEALKKEKGNKIKLSELDYEQTKTLWFSIFGSGLGTDLALAMSKNQSCFLKRYIALGKHEGGFKFGRLNEDPNKKSQQVNIGTFQISESFNKGNNVVKKHLQTLKKGLSMANQVIDISAEEKLANSANISNRKEVSRQVQESLCNKGISVAQQDLLSHFGYIQSQRGGKSTFSKLANDNLSRGELIYLMSTTVQGGNPTIGNDVANMTTGDKTMKV